jgi:hypothetical protein
MNSTSASFPGWALFVSPRIASRIGSPECNSAGRVMEMVGLCCEPPSAETFCKVVLLPNRMPHIRSRPLA